MNCTNCDAPTRKLWVLFGEHRQPTLTEVQTGNWIVLQRCSLCGALWCLSPYEPYASFPFVALWPYDEARWQRTHAIDEGKTLCGWHAFMVAQHYRSLPADELQQVESWRRRSSGHNPIDSAHTFQAADIPNGAANA